MVQFKSINTDSKVVEIDDWNPNLCSRNVFTFWATVPGLPQQELPIPFWEIVEHQISKGNIFDYADTSEGVIIINTGSDERYCQVDDQLIVTHGKRVIYTYQEYIKEHMSDEILIDFVNEILKEDLPTKAVLNNFEKI